jgi:hypothetical protein
MDMQDAQVTKVMYDASTAAEEDDCRVWAPTLTADRCGRGDTNRISLPRAFGSTLTEKVRFDVATLHDRQGASDATERTRS